MPPPAAWIATPDEGQVITFTITLTNHSTSTDATNVVVTDVLPAGVTYSSDDGGGDYNLGTSEWSVGTLLSSTSAILNITVNVDAGTGGTTITNEAAITAADQSDPVLANNSDSVDIDVNPATVPTCGGSAATIIGTAGDAIRIGTAGIDVIVGLGGNDILIGLAGRDKLCGNEGHNFLIANSATLRLVIEPYI